MCFGMVWIRSTNQGLPPVHSIDSWPKSIMSWTDTWTLNRLLSILARPEFRPRLLAAAAAAGGLMGRCIIIASGGTTHGARSSLTAITTPTH